MVSLLFRQGLRSAQRVDSPDAVVVYPEMCFVDPDMSGGKAFLEKTLEKDEANFIDLKQTITNLWVVGNTAFVEGYFSGSKLGGTIVDQAEGSEMKLRFLDRIEIEDQKVKLIYAFYDTALLYQIQLGLEGPTRAIRSHPGCMDGVEP